MDGLSHAEIDQRRKKAYINTYMWNLAGTDEPACKNGNRDTGVEKKMSEHKAGSRVG